MQVLVTGSSGKIGREAVKALQAAGHEVLGLDLKGGIFDGVRTVGCDCTDFGQVMGAVSGVDITVKPEAIVHLAGIPSPALGPDHTVFTANTISTYNIFSAAVRVGIRRVVWASSETVLGLPFPTAPAFVPLDESHPDRPEWSYSLSKKLGETMAEEFARWHSDLTILSLRFSFVADAADYAYHKVDPLTLARKANLWSYIDSRDAGEACRLALEADLIGHHRMIIAAADSMSDIPSADLLKSHYGEVPVRGDISGTRSLLNGARARELIGFSPRHSWRDAD